MTSSLSGCFASEKERDGERVANERHALSNCDAMIRKDGGKHRCKTLALIVHLFRLQYIDSDF